MYSVTIGIKSKDGLLAVVDWVLRTDGLTLVALKLDPASKAATKGKAAPAGGGAPAKRKQQGPGVSAATMLEVIRKTFSPGKPFKPHQIVALAMARGVPKGAFYGVLITLAKRGDLTRPEPGSYALADPNDFKKPTKNDKEVAHGVGT